MRNKRISVCMTTYNGEHYILDQLNSILNQLKDNDEVLISDDGSIDNTIKIIESIGDPRIKLFHNSFRNIILNFEFVLCQVSGDFVFLSDQDDVWYENKVEIIMALLKTNDLVYTNASIFKGSKEDTVLFNQKNKHGYLRNFVKNNCLGATMAFKSDLLNYSLPFPKKIPMHDMWIYFISSIYGKSFYYNKPLIYYRRHGGNASNASEKTENTFFKIISIRTNLIIAICKRVFTNFSKQIK